MKKDSGMALIFDALAFLTIITIVAAAMMLFVRTDVCGDEGDEFAEEVHTCMLSCSYYSDGDPTTMTVLDAVRSYIASGNATLKASIMDQVEKILDSYLLPLYRYEWSAEMDGHWISTGPIDQERRSVYVSTIDPDVGLTITLKIVH